MSLEFREKKYDRGENNEKQPEITERIVRGKKSLVAGEEQDKIKPFFFF